MRGHEPGGTPSRTATIGNQRNTRRVAAGARGRGAAVLLALVALLLAGGLVAVQRRVGATSAATVPQLAAVYLADPVAPVLDPALAREWGIALADSPASLLALTTSNAPEAIIVDRTVLPLVDAGWLRDQQGQGRLIVGLDVPPAQLAALVGYTGATDKFRQDWGGQPFYSFAYRWQQGGRVTQAGLSSDVITSPLGFIGRLASALQAQREGKAQPAGGATAAATRPAR